MAAPTSHLPPLLSSPKKTKRTPVPVSVPMASATFYLLFLDLIPGRRLSDGAPIRVAGWGRGVAY